MAVGLRPPRAFDAACRMVVDYLAAALPMGAWAVSRVDGNHQTMLVASDTAYGVLAPGVDVPWSDALCRTMVSGETPRIVPDTAAVPDLAGPVAAAEALTVRVGAYVGTPIVGPRGDLFGTVLGIHPVPLLGRLEHQEALLDLLSSLLTSVLEADHTAVETARELERAVSEAETDALTGLLNRRGWQRWLAREEDRFRRFGDPATVVVADLDGLKWVNDTYGHDAGDRHLRQAAATLAAACRAGDPLARLGGDEFGLVAPVGADDARRLAARLQAVMTDAGVPCSLGVAPYQVGTGFGQACADADAAMYEDKRARRIHRGDALVAHEVAAPTAPAPRRP